MRDLFIFALIFATVPFVLKRPVYGVMVFTWLSLMNPHRLAYASAYSFPFAAMITGLTLVSMVMSREPKKLPNVAILKVLGVFLAWMTITGFFAFEPERAWTEWDRVMKSMFMIFVSLALLNSERDIKLFAWVVGLSLGFFGAKGGIFTIMSGGSYRVMGPPESYITDNNDLALALLTTVPIIWYLALQAPWKWMRWGLLALAGLTVTAAAGSYSRGALLAGAAMLVVLWLKNKNKVRTGIVLLMVVALVVSLMPEQWFARMDTISTYQQDSSAGGRINAWHFAFNLASHNFFGGGYRTFTPRMFAIYAPDPLNIHAPHSIWFQVMGEHGFVGLALFVIFLVLAWRTGSRVVRFCRGKPELKWAGDLAAMCQVSMVGFAVGGSFLSLAYFDLFYDIVILMVALEKLLILKTVRAAPAPAPAGLVGAQRNAPGEQLQQRQDPRVAPAATPTENRP
jgi:probable O-glycosylation ligase (exosortase A-associated)